MGCRNSSAEVKREQYLKIMANHDAQMKKKQEVQKKAIQETRLKNINKKIYSGDYTAEKVCLQTSIENHYGQVQPQIRINLCNTSDLNKQSFPSSQPHKNTSEMEEEQYKRILLDSYSKEDEQKKMSMRQKIELHRRNRKQNLEQISSSYIHKFKRQRNEYKSNNIKQQVKGKMLNTFQFANQSFGNSTDNWNIETNQNNFKKEKNAWGFNTVEQMFHHDISGVEKASLFSQGKKSQIKAVKIRNQGDEENKQNLLHF